MEDLERYGQDTLNPTCCNITRWYLGLKESVTVLFKIMHTYADLHIAFLNSTAMITGT